MQFFYDKEWLKNYGICFMRHRSLSEYTVFLPLFLMPAVNLAIYGISFSTLGILQMVFYSSVEEILYRGFLLSVFTRQYRINILPGIISTSLFFALMHMVNIYEGVTALYALVQGICAGAAGFCFAVLTCRERSIFPGAVIHSLINITSLGAAGQAVHRLESRRLDLSETHAAVFIIVAAVYLIYGIWIYRREMSGR